MTTLAVCMLTYKRPVLLTKALESLSRQRLSTGLIIRVVVVDNDSARSAEDIVLSMRSSFPFALDYVVEPQQGIAHARNRALKEGSDSDFMAFLDDDEVAEEDWLQELLLAQRTFQADVVTGPVLPNFENAPAWIFQGGFFAARRETNGASVIFVETNNVLVRSEFAKNYHFDLRFNETSGEDTHFFMQLLRDGARMAWASEARVHEYIPQGRTSVAWLVERAQSDANRYTRACVFLEPSLKVRACRAYKAGAAFFAGCAMFLLTGVAGQHRRVHARRLISRGVGTAKALFGSAYLYYVPGKPLR